MTRILHYSRLGDELADSWGVQTDSEQGAFLKTIDEERRQTYLLASIADNMRRLVRLMETMPTKIKNAIDREKRKAEKEKQKPQDAAPVIVNVTYASIPPSEIERAYNNGRVARRF